ncbi:MAG: hypothetical protein JXA24_05260 [Proteobacteria bacterium]|nr:hypothetical protein [Pseudomonadota bacterium]
MRVRTKMHLINGAALLAGSLIVIAFARFIILERFVAIEREMTLENAENAVEIIENEIEDIDSIAADWAHAKDTYDYVASPGQRYVERHLDPETLGAMGIDVLSIFDGAGEQLISIATDAAEGRHAPVPKGWLEALESAPILFEPPEGGAGVKGILILSEFPVMVSAHRILARGLGGRGHGTLIMGRKMDRRKIASCEGLIPGPLSVHIADLVDLPPDVSVAAGRLSPEDKIHIAALDSERIAGYGLIRDITGKRGVIIRTELPRQIYLAASYAMRYFIVAVLLVGLALWLGSAMITESAILRRLLRLEGDVNKIAAERKGTSRVKVSGFDEIASLSGSINRMLVSLELSRKELELSNIQLDRANSAKTELTTIVSHELRTPLGTIKQAIEIIRDGVDGPTSDRQRERLTLALRNVERLVRLTNELLDLTTLETGRMEMHFEMADLNEMLGDVFHLMKPAAEEKGVSLTLNLPPEGKKILCDADRIRQTIINLISNATKFTDSGGSITLSGRPLPDGVRIDVEDTGKGLREEDLPGIFEPYRRIREGKSGGSEGSGLGLPICRLLVERHGGTIEVKSRFGEGTAFSVVLPDRPPDAA